MTVNNEHRMLRAVRMKLASHATAPSVAKRA